AAIDSPLLELSIKGAKGVLFTITGGSDLSMHEVNEAAEVITSSIDPNAKVIFGAVIDDETGDEVKITVIATGFSPQNSRIMEAENERAAEEKFYHPSRPTVKEAEDKPASVARSIFSKKARKIEPDKVELPPKTKEEEELDIPAFIRKKIGK
ncbi:MAG TPA: cell division protein FtsZ, partial [Patescibacteria group bacterium]|nr:cell division protein FtsZ [Patescibacteria group bacterium]